MPEDKELRLDSGAKFNVAGEIDLRGKLYVKGIAWKDLFDGNSGSLNLYKSCDVYIDDEHVVGDEYDYSAAILLGNQSYAAYEADDSVMKIDGTEDSVVISGKVYLNKTISDDRAWDLGYDSAAVLYENQKIRFKSVRNAKKSVTATVYTYGGTNDEKTSQMPNLQSQYIYNKNKWIEADARTMEGIVQYTAMMMSFLQERSPAVGTEWNGNTNYDTTAGSDGQRIADLKYADRSGSRNVYDLWLPKSLVDGKNKDKKQKLILFIHGGSWSSGKKEDVAMLCAMYAKMGYITASLNYRLSEQSLPQDSGTLPQMDEDVFDCVMAIKAEMTKRGYDVDGMAVSGQSAGGHLALLYAGRHYETAAKPSAIPVKLVLSEFGPAEFSIETWANDRLIWDRKDIEKQNRW